MLTAGQPAPDIPLPPGAGATSLAELVAAAGQPVLVYFYPADFSPLCAAQACMIDRRRRRGEAHIPAIGVSPQGQRSHNAFARLFGLEAVLVSDPDRAIARAWGVAGALGAVRRATFVVGPDMRIADAAMADFRLAPHRRVVQRLAERSGA
ncbi:MAG: peroxiredoxin family protein [Phycisphaerales bacterium JB039]